MKQRSSRPIPPRFAAPEAIVSGARAMHVLAGHGRAKAARARRGRRIAEPVVTLYECPPLHARLTARRCALNRERAWAPLSARDSHRWRGDLAVPGTPRECATCPGVLRFAEGSGRAPRELPVAELVRAHALSEERRRRTRAAAEECSDPSLRLEDIAARLGLNRQL